MNGGVALQSHELRHMNGAGSADAAQIITKQVDHHHVLGPIFVAADQFSCQIGITFRIAMPGAGAFDWTGLNAA